MRTTSPPPAKAWVGDELGVWQYTLTFAFGLGRNQRQPSPSNFLLSPCFHAKKPLVPPEMSDEEDLGLNANSNLLCILGQDTSLL